MNEETGECPECGASMSADAVDPKAATVACDECGYEVELPGIVQSFVDFLDVPGAVSKGDVTEEDYEQIEVDRVGHALTIEISWFAWFFLIFGLMGLLGAGMGLLFFWVAASKDLTMGGRAAMAGAGLLFAAPWLLLVYRSVAAVTNSTELRVEEGRLSVTYGPLPWWGEQELDATEIEQVYCSAHSGGGGSSSTSGGRTTYTVIAKMAGGETVEIVEKVAEQVDALGIEKELEDWLEIEDRHVEGEIDASNRS